MSNEFFKIWDGPTRHVIRSLALFLDRDIPEDIKINKSIDENKIYILSRNLEEYLSQLIQNNSGIINIDNILYYTGNLSNIELSFLLYQKEEPMFGAIFLASENLPAGLIDPENLAKFVAQEISDAVGISLNVKKYTSFEGVYFKIQGGDGLSLIENLEKTQLGRFLYLLYLRDNFSKDLRVCVVISELDPLINRVKEIEMNLAKLTKDEFLAKFPSYGKYYDRLKLYYQTKKVYQFRLELLLLVLNLSSPAISADYNQKTEKVTLNVSKTFDSLFKRCTNNESKFIISFITFDVGAGHHANIIIVDKNEKVVERYEPNGFSAIEGNYNFGIVSNQLDEQLSTYFSQYGYSYIPPADFCPKLGIQGLESIFSKNTGFCVSWSIVYAEERILSRLPRTYIAQNLLDDILTKYKLRGKSLKETGQNIESWMEQRINKIFSGMESYYKQLSKLLDIHVKYDQIKDSGVSCLILQ